MTLTAKYDIRLSLDALSGHENMLIETFVYLFFNKWRYSAKYF